MSGIAGIFNRDGAAAEPANLYSMMDAAAQRGPDGKGSWADGSVALGQLVLQATPEENPRNPLIDPLTGSVIVFDGRCDNREELLRSLAPAAEVTGSTPDAALVLAAYRKWGRDCAFHLFGDFAFALWDASEKGFFCARDIAGVNPFHYFLGQNCFVFGSDLCQVLQHPSVPSRPNKNMAAEILSGEVFHLEDTLYKDVQRLPPAHWLWIGRERTIVNRYWDLQPGSRIRHSSREEYEQHFRQLFTHSLKCRLRRRGEPAIRLSGGRDSPAISGLAQTLLDQEQPPGRLRSYSLYFPGLDCDESRQIQATVDFNRLAPFAVDFPGFPVAPDWPAEVARSRDLPLYPTMMAMEALFSRARRDGVRISLTGLGAYRGFGGTPYPYLGMLRDRRLSGLARAARAGRARTVLRNLAWPLLPGPLRTRLSGRNRRSFQPGFIEPGFVAETRLEDRLQPAGEAGRFADLAQCAFHQRFTSGDSIYNHEMQNRFSAGMGIEDRHPFLDRRLVEFAFAIPDWLHHDPRRLKPLLLDSARDWMAPEVWREPGYGELSCLYLAAMRLDAFREVIQNLEIARAGWVSAEKTRTAYERLLQHSEPGKGARYEDMGLMYSLWWVFAIESWFKEL